MKCPICGKTVPASKGVKPRKYCSSKCATKAAHKALALRGYRKPKNFRHVCLFCGKAFFTCRSGRSFYCSRECANNAISLKRSGKPKSARLRAVLDRRERKRIALENCRETASVTIEERGNRVIETRGFCPIGCHAVDRIHHS